MEWCRNAEMSGKLAEGVEIRTHNGVALYNGLAGVVAEVVEIQGGVISGLCNEPDSTLKRRGRLHHGTAYQRQAGGVV
jgi:hypothetical protein